MVEHPPLYCVSCRAQIVFGVVRGVQVNGEGQIWCMLCAEEASAALWPEEEWGPRVPEFHPLHKRMC